LIVGEGFGRDLAQVLAKRRLLGQDQSGRSEQHVRHLQQMVVTPDPVRLAEHLRGEVVGVGARLRTVALLAGLVQYGVRPARRAHARSPLS